MSKTAVTSFLVSAARNVSSENPYTPIVVTSGTQRPLIASQRFDGAALCRRAHRLVVPPSWPRARLAMIAFHRRPRAQLAQTATSPGAQVLGVDERRSQSTRT